MAEEFHCKECAGLAKSKGELCTTCDGEGNPKLKDKENSIKKANKKK